MARCPHLVYKGGYRDQYQCDLCPNKIMYGDSSEVKYVCKPDYGEEYRKCQIWKDNT